MEVNPRLAALILLLFLAPLAGKFYLSGQEAHFITGNYYLTDDRDGRLLLQLGDRLLRVEPASSKTEEIKPRVPGFSPRSQIGVFSNGDWLVRVGEWDMSVGLYLNLADLAPADSPELDTLRESAQEALDKAAATRDSEISSKGSVLARCPPNGAQCSPFPKEERKFQANYNIRILPDDSVMITDGIVHKIVHFSEGGEGIASYTKGLRYPKRAELAEDGSFYFANTNHHRIERVTAKAQAREGGTYQTLGSAGAPVAVGSEVTGDPEYTWPITVKFFAGQWWVINMGNSMRRGVVHRFNEQGKFLGRWPLADYAEPLDLLVFEGQLLISDAATGVIHRVDGDGQALGPWGFQAATEYALPRHEKHALLAGINSLLTWWLALLVLTLFAVTIRQSRKNRGTSAADEIRPTFSILNSRETPMLISNIEVIPNKRVVSHLGLVQGSTVRAKHAGRDIMASFKNIFGGELAGYTELLQESREEAVARMSEQAQAIGANAVINVRFSTSAIAAGASEILAYGTAVQVVDA